MLVKCVENDETKCMLFSIVLSKPRLRAQISKETHFIPFVVVEYDIDWTRAVQISNMRSKIKEWETILLRVGRVNQEVKLASIIFLAKAEYGKAWFWPYWTSLFNIWRSARSRNFNNKLTLYLVSVAFLGEFSSRDYWKLFPCCIRGLQRMFASDRTIEIQQYTIYRPLPVESIQV